VSDPEKFGKIAISPFHLLCILNCAVHYKKGIEL